LGYISPICPETPHGRIFTKFCTAVEVVDVHVITRDKYFSDRLRGVDSVGSNIQGSHRLSQWLLTQGWHDCAACNEGM